MIIGIPKDPMGSNIVSATPFTVGKLRGLGYEVRVEAGAGMACDCLDERYLEEGATLVDAPEAWGSDIVISFEMPGAKQLDCMRQGAILMTRMNPGANPDILADLAQRGITGLSMDAVPRISRAQSLDVRSSIANISGYRAVIEASEVFGRMLTGQVTAAGKFQPAKVYVIGAGVAGLAAIGQAGSMGAQVFATDVRPEVADQVESLGATFVEIPVKQESKDGYAAALTEDQQKQVLEVYARQAAESDIVITTAQVPGRPAPLLLTAEAVAGMNPGSVVVDMGASELGGNCELSRPGEIVHTENGVAIVGFTDLADRMPRQASQMFGQNMVNFFKLVTPAKDGMMVLDQEDVIVRGVTVTLDGKITWPPPEVRVSAAPKAEDTEAAGAAQTSEETAPAEKSAFARHWWKVALALLGVALILAAPATMTAHFVVFELACVVGFYVITNVTHSLHTPLMSVTNAISGIIIVGALLQAVHTDQPIVMVLSIIAMAIASINIFGGFLVTNRMLKMFEGGRD